MHHGKREREGEPQSIINLTQTMFQHHLEKEEEEEEPSRKGERERGKGELRCCSPETMC